MTSGTVYVNIDFTSRSFAEYNIAWTDGVFLNDTISTPTTDYSYSGERDDATDCTITFSLEYLGSNTRQVHPVPVITYESQGDDMYITVTWKDGVGIIVNVDFTSYDFSTSYVSYSSVSIDPSLIVEYPIGCPTSDYSKFYSVESVSDNATITFSGQPDGLTPVVTKTTDDDGFIVFNVDWDDGTGVDMWVTGTLYVYTNGAWVQAQMYRHNGAEFVAGTANVFTRYVSPITTEPNDYGTTVIIKKHTTEANDHGTTVVIG